MKKTSCFLISILSVFSICALQADTLELADGSLLEGDFIGSSNGIIMFDTGGSIEAFPENKVVAVFFSAGVETREEVQAAMEEAQASVSVPAGTRLVIRTIDAINTSRHSAGHRFRGQLEGALVVGGETVAPRGAYVHGRLTQASQSNLAGNFTDILIDEQLIAITTGDLEVQSANDAGTRAAGRTARAAAVGGLLGGSDGARRGARLGVGSAVVASGNQPGLDIPAGTIVEATLSAALVIQ